MGPSFQVDREIQRPSVWSKSLPSLHRWRSDYSHPTANIHHKTQPSLTAKQFKRNIKILNTGRQLLQTLAPHTEQCSKHLYQIVLWLQGVSLLLRVQHYHHQHQKHHFTDLQRIFQQSQVTANSYTLARFRQQGIVYCRVTTASNCSGSHTSAAQNTL